MNNTANLLKKFENVEIDYSEKIDQEDINFCKKEEKKFKKHISFLEDYINFLKNYADSESEIIFGNFAPENLLKKAKEHVKEIKKSFFSNIYWHFRSKHNVYLESKTFNEINYKYVIQDIFKQLEGLSFKEKKIQQYLKSLKSFISKKRIEEKKEKLILKHFIYFKEPSYYSQSKSIYLSYDSQKNLEKLFEVFTFFEVQKEGNLYNNTLKEFTSYSNSYENLLEKKELNYKKISAIKLYKNGRFDIFFSSEKNKKDFVNMFMEVNYGKK